MGWFDTAKKWFGKAVGHAKLFGKNVVSSLVEAHKDNKHYYPPSVLNILKECGSKRVTDIKVCREVVAKNTEALLSIISGGKWEAAKKKYGYDNFFHLFMLVSLEDGKVIHIEKNEVIRMSYYARPCNDGMDVPLRNTFTLDEMMERTKRRMGDDKFFGYSALENNCQNFILNILKASGLDNPAIERFTHQNLDDLVKELPAHVKPTAKVATDIAAVINTALQKSFIPSDKDEQEARTAQNNAYAAGYGNEG
jgi:hypothetical protein